MVTLLVLENKPIRICLEDYLELNEAEKPIVYAPSSFDEKVFSELLDKRPERVLMDIDYGSEAEFDFTPFTKARDIMRGRGYNTTVALLGISVFETPFLKKLSQDIGVPIIEKYDTQRIYKFILGH